VFQITIPTATEGEYGDEYTFVLLFIATRGGGVWYGYTLVSFLATTAWGGHDCGVCQ